MKATSIVSPGSIFTVSKTSGLPLIGFPFLLMTWTWFHEGASGDRQNSGLQMLSSQDLPP